MTEYSINVNGTNHQVDVEEDTPLLWVLRDTLGLVGTKYGCGIGQCGSCTVLVNGTATRACLTSMSLLKGTRVTTIEGLSENLSHPVQMAWQEIDVPQCGYCQAGQVMSAASLLSQNKNPSEADIKAAMKGNICRCGTYPRILKAVKKAVELMNA